MRAKEKHKHTKNDKEKGTGITKYTGQKKINEGHSIERVWHSASRELLNIIYIPISPPVQPHPLLSIAASKNPHFHSNNNIKILEHLLKPESNPVVVFCGLVDTVHTLLKVVTLLVDACTLAARVGLVGSHLLDYLHLLLILLVRKS